MTENGNVIYFEVNNKTEKEKIITIRNTETNILKINNLKNIKIGVNQYYNFECEIIKLKEVAALQIHDLQEQWEITHQVDLDSGISDNISKI